MTKKQKGLQCGWDIDKMAAYNIFCRKAHERMYSMNWENLREEEFEAAIERSKGVCVIPLGCLEKHGQHLPVGTDSLKAMRIAEDAAAIEEVTVFPAGMWLGEVSGFHADTDPGAIRKRGGIGMNPRTLLTVLEELCDEIARNGYRKILLLNSHGGNVAMLNHFVRAQCYTPKNYVTMWAPITSPLGNPVKMYPVVLERRDEFPYLTEEDMEALRRFSETGTGGGHADWKETAYMLHYYPDLVDETKYEAESGRSTHRADHLADLGIQCGRFWPSNYPNAYNGFPPVGCSANIGKAMAKLSVERLVEIFKAVKEDEDSVRMAMRLPKED